MISFETQGLVNPDDPVPISINNLIDFLSQQKTPFATKMVESLRQIQQAIALIWNAIQQPDQVDLTSIQTLFDNGSLGVTINEFGITIQSQSAVTSTSLSPADILLSDIPSNTFIRTLIDTNTGDTTFEFNRAGTVFLLKLTGAGVLTIDAQTGFEFRVNGIKVLTDQQATVAAVTGTAGATYTATEQAMLNDLKTAVNNIRSRLQGMGTIA